MATDEKIAVGVALVVIFAFFVTFLPAFWSDEEDSTIEVSTQTPTLDVAP